MTLSNSEGRAWVDYDNDGDLDLFVANAAGPTRAPSTGTTGDGVFTAVTDSGLTDARRRAPFARLLGRLRQRRLARPLPGELRRRTPSITTTETARSPASRTARSSQDVISADMRLRQLRLG